MKRICLISACFGILACVVAIAQKTAAPPAVEMRTYATAFLKTMDQEQIKQVQMPYDSGKRVQWHFIPMPTRKGIPLRDMNLAQQTAALRLVRAALSEVGYRKASQIMLLEGVLRQMEGPGSEERRDPRKYYVTIFGDPQQTGKDTPWGLSFEGHHLSLNFVCRGDAIVDSTPQFFASNPALIKSEVSGPLGKGTRVLTGEEVLAFELVNSLSPEQLELAKIADEAFPEIRFAGDPQPTITEKEGIPYLKMNAAQQKLLSQLIAEYNSAMSEDVVKERLELIDAAGWDGIHFAWAGALKPGIGHYYRVRGETFLIEFVNNQPDAEGNPANHIHCVWRDMTGDFDLPITD